MTTYRALETSADEQLGPFSAILRAGGIAHHIYEEAGQQIVLVGREIDVPVVRETYARWQRGELKAPVVFAAKTRRVALSAHLLAALRLQPVTVAAVVLSLLGFAVVALHSSFTLLSWLSFSDFHQVGRRLVFDSALASYADGEYWRLLTPVFLHFGMLHVTFNLLWYWQLGRRLEQVRGSIAAFGVLVLTGAGGNIVQYLVDPDVLFGGMSGVIYGVLGYAWMWNRFSGTPQIALPPGMLGFMLVWLVVCMSGFIEALGFGAIANAAHIAGLLLGMLLGFAAAMIRDRSRDGSPPPPG